MRQMGGVIMPSPQHQMAPEKSSHHILPWSHRMKPFRSLQKRDIGHHRCRALANQNAVRRERHAGAAPLFLLSRPERGRERESMRDRIAFFEESNPQDQQCETHALAVTAAGLVSATSVCARLSPRDAGQPSMSHTRGATFCNKRCLLFSGRQKGICL